MAKAQQEEREPIEAHVVSCWCGVTKLFDGRRISQDAEAWAFVHGLTHQRKRRDQ